MAHCECDETRGADVTEQYVPQQIQLHVSWSAANDIPVAHVNQFATQLGPPAKNGIPDGVYVILGNLVPPIIAGDDAEARQKSIEAVQESGIQVDVYGRYHLSRDRLDDLIEALQAIANAYDVTAGNRSGMETGEKLCLQLQ